MAVVKACGASRSYLEKRFRAETGRTILDAIHRRTMEDVKHLLLDTDKSVAVIAQETGFPSASGLCSMFRRLTGQSTSEFRATRQPRRRPTKTPRSSSMRLRTFRVR
jgi:LacI family transcriptional regulator